MELEGRHANGMMFSCATDSKTLWLMAGLPLYPQSQEHRSWSLVLMIIPWTLNRKFILVESLMIFREIKTWKI